MEPRSPAHRRGKAVLDRTVALVALVLLTPVMVVIAIAVRLSSPGPALYRQARIGRGGRPFTLLKFRSMSVDAERRAANITPAGDPRVTRVGRLLRRTYLDELPQLFNVLRGDMSLVGPRPETPEFVVLWTAEQRRLLTVRPGLAGPSTLGFMDEAQLLAGASDAEQYYRDTLMHQRTALDLRYLEVSSVRYDVALLVRQVLAIVGTEGPAFLRDRRRGLALLSALVLVMIVVLSLPVDLLHGDVGETAGFLAHAAAYMVLAVCVLSWSGRRVPALAVAAALTVVGVTVELAQMGVAGRDAQVLDAAANIAGIAAAIPIAGWLHRSRTSRRKQQSATA